MRFTCFFKYDCCGVSEITGTTNDFDNTPWCTTSGSCQDTSSQIPKTCCKSITRDNYENAPKDCHEFLTPGSFKDVNCFSFFLLFKALSFSIIHKAFFLTDIE